MTLPERPAPPAVREALTTLVEEHERATIVRLVGELDADDAQAVRGLLAEQVLSGPGNLVLDVSRLSFLDSAGLAALIAAHKGTRSAGTALVLAGSSPAVDKVLAVTGLDAVIRRAPSVDVALEQLPPPF